VKVKKQYDTYIFGGFTSQSWQGSNVTKTDPQAFLFSLVNNDRYPRILSVKGRGANAIYCDPTSGPSFGRGDLVINKGSRGTAGKKGESKQFGSTFVVEMFAEGSDQSLNYLAGSPDFEITQLALYKRG